MSPHAKNEPRPPWYMACETVYRKIYTCTVVAINERLIRCLVISTPCRGVQTHVCRSLGLCLCVIGFELSTCTYFGSNTILITHNIQKLCLASLS